MSQTVWVGGGGLVVGVGQACFGDMCEWTGDVFFVFWRRKILTGGQEGGWKRTLVVGLMEQRAAQAMAASLAHLQRWDWGVRGDLRWRYIGSGAEIDLRLSRRRDSSRGGIHMLLWRSQGAVGQRGDRRLSLWRSARDFLSL